MSKQRIILTGGAGYIGGATALLLKQKGFEPIVLDALLTGHPQALPGIEILKVDLRDSKKTLETFKSLAPAQGLIHFAAFALVPESFEKSHDYFNNNLLSALNVAEGVTQTKIPYVLHSSSCTVYGTPKSFPIPETASLNPDSPYGETKLIAERLLNRYSTDKHWKVAHLRYFNPAGALPSFNWGECHQPETHLIPKLVSAALEDQALEVFGTDYDTPDGSCIRDFIHIADLAEAHLLALDWLSKTSQTGESLNIGMGRGVSVLEVVKTAEKVLGRPIKTTLSPKRAGDPPQLWADTRKMEAVLGWKPKKTLSEILEDDWRWRKNQVK